MPYEKVKLADGRWLWRCSDCGHEHTDVPVAEHKLGPAPHHDCPNEGRIDMKAILDDQTEKETPTLHLGDIVEEIATKRRGKIDTGPTVASGGQIAPNWRVIFTDGQKPLYKHFDDARELRVVSCPHPQDGPSFKLKRSIMPKI
jgi:hypothetical protein